MKNQLFGLKPIEEKKEEEQANNESNTFVFKENTNISQEQIQDNQTPQTIEKLDDKPIETNEEIKNPVAPVEKVDNRHASYNPIHLFMIMVGMIVFPGYTLSYTIEVYKYVKDSLVLYLSFIIYSSIFANITLLISKAILSLKGKYPEPYFLGIKIPYHKFIFSNHLSATLIPIIFFGVLIIIISIIRYATSFFGNKGCGFATILGITSLSFVPLIAGVTIVFPLLIVFSLDLSIISLIILILYSYIIFISSINEYVKLKKLNEKIIYNIVNSIILIATIFILLSILILNDLITI